MRKNRDPQLCIDELQNELPQWNGNVELLLAVLKKLSKKGIIPKSWREMFEQYWGLGVETPLSYEQIGNKYGYDHKSVSLRCKKTLQLLRESKW